MGGSDGTQAKQADKAPAASAVNAASTYANAQGGGNLGVRQAINGYGSGSLSLDEALASVADTPGGQQALLTNGLSGSKAASDFVQNDPMTSGLFGKGGIQDQSQGRYDTLNQQYDHDRDRVNTDDSEIQGDRGSLDTDRDSLMGRDESYGLKDSDLAAYSQGGANISRMFSNSDQSLSQSLADRGLASAPSGVAGQAYAGQYGNKMEQLSQLQNQISQNRIQTAQNLAQARTSADLQRLGQANTTLGQHVGLLNNDSNVMANNNNLMTNLGALGQNAVNSQFNRNLAGSENSYNQLASSAGMQMQNLGLDQNMNNATFAQQQATKSPSFGQRIGDAAQGAIAGDVGSLAGSPGNVIDNASKQGGAAAGKSLAAALG